MNRRAFLTGTAAAALAIMLPAPKIAPRWTVTVMPDTHFADYNRGDVNLATRLHELIEATWDRDRIVAILGDTVYGEL